jgi:hypothetical protein
MATCGSQVLAGAFTIFGVIAGPTFEIQMVGAIFATPTASYSRVPAKEW